MLDERKAVGSIRPCGPTGGLPERWSFREKRDIEIAVAADATRAQRFAAALHALAKDMRENGKGTSKTRLEHGEAVALDEGGHGYRFPNPGDTELHEDAKVTCWIGKSKSSGQIASASQEWVYISLDRDFGPTIAACDLSIDKRELIIALATRLEKACDDNAGLNLALADAALDNRGEPGDRDSAGAILDTDRNLNRQQQEFIEHALAHPLTYLWGPPGTGKSRTLAVLIELLLQRGQRVLILSNTNPAVDQLFQNLCAGLTSGHPLVEDGKVVRLGKSLGIDEEYQEFVTVAGIVRRKSADIRARKALLAQQVQLLRLSAATMRRVLDAFAHLDAVNAECAKLAQQRANCSRELEETQAAGQREAAAAAALQAELAQRLAARWLRRMFLRSEQAIRDDLAACAARQEVLGGHAGSLCRALDAPALRASEKAAAARRDELRAQLLGQNKDATESLWRGTEEKIAAALDEISAINVEIKQIEMSIIPNAKIIGATVTKAYLNPDQFRGFDALILDEASMVLLPAIYFISALVSQKVVIAGDFRQLSPILESDQAAIKEMIGANVFETAGITQAIREQAKPERTVMLTEQYRMNAAICELISRRMYAGRLTTGMPSRPQAPRLPPPFDSALTVIDTSVIQPFSTDRRNMMNALAIRNLVRAFQLDGLATAAKTDSAARSLLGICTPFAKQRDLLQRLLEPTGVVVGTVHRYQGDEKLAMIIDVTDSTGERASKWAKAADPDDEGCKLYNVAVSRAKEHLIFVANLNYLDASLPADSLLRDLLHAASTRGRIIDVREVCALEPIDDDLKQLDRTLHFDPEAMRTCFFTGPDFNAASVADMRQATSGIAIFSGFVTARRVAKYAQLFQQKIAQGVRIRCVTRPPRNNGSIDIRDARGALEALVAMGCIVETRWDIHQKCIIIDDNIVWHGSLNPLSYTGSTDEFMQRAKGADVAREASLTLALDSRVRPDKAQGLSLRAENPRCDACGQRATYRAERGRRVWQCEDACGWEEPFGSKQRSRPRSDGGGTSAGRASGGRSSESRPRASKDHFRTT